MDTKSLQIITELFENGVLKSAVAVPVPMMADEYHLHVFASRNSPVAILGAQRGGARVFKSLDACASMARKIGFSELSVVLRYPDWS